MRKILYIVFSIALIIPYSVVVIYNEISISIHKKEIKQKIKENILYAEYISVNYLNPIEKHKILFENSHEFILNNNIYDIIDITIKDKCLIIKCYNDRKEKKLLVKLEKSKKETHSNKKFYKYANSNLVLYPLVILRNNIYSFPQKIYHKLLNNNYKNCFLDGIYQPPKHVI